MECTPLPEINTPFYAVHYSGPVLTMSRELKGVLHNRTFSGRIGPVLQIRDSAVLINQCVNTAFLTPHLIAIKGVA
jgi:hypothetical protein